MAAQQHGMNRQQHGMNRMGADGSVPVAASTVNKADDGPLVLVGGGGRSGAFRRVLADLSGRTVGVPAIAEAAATGACVQAAATLFERLLDEVQADWGLGGGELVEPVGTVDLASVRQAYAQLRG